MTSDDKFPKWLTYHSWRNTAWVEHDGPPIRAINYWKGGRSDMLERLHIYQISEDGQMIPRTVEEVLNAVSGDNADS